MFGFLQSTTSKGKITHTAFPLGFSAVRCLRMEEVIVQEVYREADIDRKEYQLLPSLN